MRFRSIFLALALLSGLSSWAGASVYTDAAARLNGEWRGENFVLRVDARRAQASLDPDHPFAWQRFLIKEVTSKEVVFSVGPELYDAQIDGDVLTLSGTSFLGKHVLFRETGQLRGTTSN